MDFEGFRDRFNEYRELAEREGQERRDSFLCSQRLREFYDKLDTRLREMADRVIAEWTLSPDVAVRWDAIYLIGEYRIRSASSSLRCLADRLATSSEPGAPHEVQRIMQVLAELEY